MVCQVRLFVGASATLSTGKSSADCLTVAILHGQLLVKPVATLAVLTSALDLVSCFPRECFGVFSLKALPMPQSMCVVNPMYFLHMLHDVPVVFLVGRNDVYSSGFVFTGPGHCWFTADVPIAGRVSFRWRLLCANTGLRGASGVSGVPQRKIAGHRQQLV